MTDKPLINDYNFFEKKLVRAEFVGNPENLESILQISKKKEESSASIIKPWSEVELIWSDNHAIAQLESKRVYQTK